MLLYGAFLAFIGLVILILNLTVLRVYKQNKNLQVPKNYFIAALATTDLLTVILSIFPFVFYTFYGYWTSGKIWCITWLVFDHVLMSAANYTVLVIALDRYFAICHPLSHRVKFKPKVAKIAILAAWVFAILLWAPPIISKNVKTNEDEKSRRSKIEKG